MVSSNLDSAVVLVVLLMSLFCSVAKAFRYSFVNFLISSKKALLMSNADSISGTSIGNSTNFTGWHSTRAVGVQSCRSQITGCTQRQLIFSTIEQKYLEMELVLDVNGKYQGKMIFCA